MRRVMPARRPQLRFRVRDGVLEGQRERDAQALAESVRCTAVPWRGDLLYYGAPYGVAYFVASWMPA